MILIISEELDISTNKIISWLKLLRKDFFRINSADRIGLTYSAEDIILYKNDIPITISQISTVFYRRGDLKFNFKFDIPRDMLNGFNYYFNKEWNVVRRLIYSKLEKRTIGSYFEEVNSNKTFRYICTDCRANWGDDQSLKKPKHCKYDPYKAVWG